MSSHHSVITIEYPSNWFPFLAISVDSVDISSKQSTLDNGPFEEVMVMNHIETYRNMVIFYPC